MKHENENMKTKNKLRTEEKGKRLGFRKKDGIF